MECGEEEMRKQLPRGAEREPSLDISKRGRKDSDNISHQGRLAKGVPNTFSLVPSPPLRGVYCSVESDNLYQTCTDQEAAFGNSQTNWL